jgi:hypothetical protein
MPRRGGKRIGVREAVRFVGERLNLRPLVDVRGDGAVSPLEQIGLDAALATIAAPRVRGSLRDNLVALALYLRGERPTTRKGKGARGGRPSKRGAREALRRVARIVEHNASDHAPKVTALVLWLVDLAPYIVEPAGETSAEYLARITRAVEKLSRTR